MAAAATGDGGCQGVLGRCGGAAGVFVMAGRRLVGSLGRAKEGVGVGSPEGCYTITVRRHGAHMYLCVSVRDK